ncbi:Vgb family protein [Congregibacter litoralis]|uniref:Streptogramin lyase n=1 Tax=Congregibacter litoralis KT71 TaxID=314285 RepID=A4A437_9GAMM|nr:Streptogramin lyase [Congregibacter litoralis]EAQ99460.2 Streptogramin lyase [Congregibacter litoralis KT71]
MTSRKSSPKGTVFPNFALACLLSLSFPSLPAFAQPQQLPPGDGKALVEKLCIGCHSTSRILNSAGFDSAGEWRALINTMLPLADAQAETIAGYLATHFPAKEERKPTLISGPVDITIEEWIAPTLGQRSRDPVEAPDGSIWWTGMWASLTGRLDPETGEMEEYYLPPAARPHSIVPDAQGNIWYTGNGNATIGKLDPDTGTIEEFPTEARDPHTAVFHPNGNLYFTSQQAGMLGRLNPETGELREVKTRARPYGIKVGPKGRLWVAHNGTNAIGTMDPDTMALEYFDIPDEKTRIRRLDIASDGRVWYVNSSLGRIGVLDPDTGETREWPSPSGPKSHPYALAVIDDVVWYNESGMRPDALVRFDPATETFQSWAIPSGVGIVRHVWVTREGELLIHQSSSNRIGRVTIQGPD